MNVVTHDGSFHADEVFALAALGRLGEPLEIVRTRDRDAIAAADVRVDVGFAADAAAGSFDHHQRGGAGARENGIAYASFGLVWREHGAAACGGDADVAARVDEVLVQGVDAQDTGQQLTTVPDGIRPPMTVSGAIGAFNPSWDEELDAAAERERFDAAVAFAAGILDREIASAAAGLRARRIVEAGIAASRDPRVVELEANAPWKEVVVASAPEALYVLYPKRQGWGVEAVPVAPGTFDNRRDLPEAWAGLDGPELAALTGVQDALFCHAKRFLAVARSREGAERLAALALEAA